MDWMLFAGLLLAFSAIIVRMAERDKIAIALLVLAAFFIRLYAACLDPFLHDWDEKFHALVARNLMDNPFYPVLKKNIAVPFDYKAWCCNEVWLHKQPLFMWQMALSMKIFGVSEFALRYPSVLMGTIMVFLVYRVATLLTQDKNLSFGAAMLMCFSNYHLELTSGYHGMDHNDVAFGFYVLASIWAFCEYTKRENKVLWLILIGVFAGCAVLNKWLTGLLVYACWGLNILFRLKKEGTPKEILHLFLSLIICLVVFLPWQIYTHIRFPIEAKHEMEHNARHVFEVVEGHGGTTSFYWDNFSMYFGNYIWILLPAGLVITTLTKTYSSQIKVLLISAILIIYIFFSYIVQSKLNTYFFVMAPVGFILMAIPISRFRMPTVLTMLLYVVMAVTIFNYNEIRAKHDPGNENRIARAYNTEIYKELRKYLPPGYNIVGNLNANADIECMFFNKDVTAYHFNFSPAEVEVLKNKKLKIAVFKDHSGYGVPEHVLKYPEVYVINKDLWPQ